MAGQNQQDRGIMGMFGGHKKADQEPVTGTHGTGTGYGANQCDTGAAATHGLGAHTNATGTGHHAAAGTTVPPTGAAQEHGHGGVMGKLHRSGSSSSSSSSEDESGVKKERKSKKGGIKDKIKNVLPGTHNKQQDDYATGTGTGTGEKKHGFF